LLRYWKDGDVNRRPGRDEHWIISWRRTQIQADLAFNPLSAMQTELVAVSGIVAFLTWLER